MNTVNVTTLEGMVKRDSIRPGYFVGIDLHKKFMQVTVMDSTGILIHNERIKCDKATIRKRFSKMPEDAKYVIESSSVWYGMYRFLTDELNLDVMLSNPLATKMIAASKKKTDKVDVKILADLLRGDYISGCYVPPREMVSERQLVRYRARMVRERTRFKNLIHGILLQEGIQIKEYAFTSAFIDKLHKLDNWRIEKHLKTIEFLDRDIDDCDARIARA